jgi:hypothetical protein
MFPAGGGWGVDSLMIKESTPYPRQRGTSIILRALLIRLSSFIGRTTKVQEHILYITDTYIILNYSVVKESTLMIK